jgi:hypothetical protein
VIDRDMLDVYVRRMRVRALQDQWVSTWTDGATMRALNTAFESSDDVDDLLKALGVDAAEDA